MSGPGNRMVEIRREYSGEYPDALLVLTLSGGNWVLLKERHVEMEEIQGQVMRVSRRVERLQRVNDSKNYRVNCYNYSVNNGAVVICGYKPDRRRPEADAPASSYDGAVLSFGGCV